MNIEQLEMMLDHVRRLIKLADDGHLGMDKIKADLDSLHSSIEASLMILIYEKYKEEKG